MPQIGWPLSNRFRSMVLARYVCTLYIRFCRSVHATRRLGAERPGHWAEPVSGQGDGILTDSFHPSSYNGNDRAPCSADLAQGLNHQAIGEDQCSPDPILLG